VKPNCRAFFVYCLVSLIRRGKTRDNRGDEEGGEPVTKVELVGIVADRTRMTKKDVGICLDAVLSVIQEALGKGDRVQLTGFGTFEVRERSARKGRNPQTGAEITIAARQVPVFRAGKLLKDSVAK